MTKSDITNAIAEKIVFSKKFLLTFKRMELKIDLPRNCQRYL